MANLWTENVFVVFCVVDSSWVQIKSICAETSAGNCLPSTSGPVDVACATPNQSLHTGDVSSSSWNVRILPLEPQLVSYYDTIMDILNSYGDQSDQVFRNWPKACQSGSSRLPLSQFAVSWLISVHLLSFWNCVCVERGAIPSIQSALMSLNYLTPGTKRHEHLAT